MSYVGKVLRVNLSDGVTHVESLNQSWAEKYLGGKGLGIKYLYEELLPGIDPLSAENKLILATGIFTGTAIPCSGKLSIVTKSPATGTILDCSIGGHFAAELKYAGYDLLIIEGRATKPSLIKIIDSHVTIEDADWLWGSGVQQTELTIRKKINEEVKILSIGPAGENQVKMACITSELYRQAGRGGVGAVMGSKNLKAIVVKGSGGVPLPKATGFMSELNKIMYEDTLSERNLWAASDGTPSLVDYCNELGILPTRNFQMGSYEKANQINSDTLNTYKVGRKGCFSCSLGCGIYAKTLTAQVEGPEYETLAMAGSNCDIDNIEAIIQFNQLCDDLGIDTISAGNTIAFAMELTEKGIKDFGLRFGDVEAYLNVPGLIAHRQGIGLELGLGVKALAKIYGGAQFAMHIKGLEIPGYDPRGAWGMGLAYATSDRGACHMRAWTVGEEVASEVGPYSIEGKAQLVIKMQNFNAVKFSAIICDFWALSLETLAELLSMVTGSKITASDVITVGERIVNLARQYNVREGFARKEDVLPDRFFYEVLTTGGREKNNIPSDQFNQMMSQYYLLRGWDEEGRPLENTLNKLDV